MNPAFPAIGTRIKARSKTPRRSETASPRNGAAPCSKSSPSSARNNRNSGVVLDSLGVLSRRTEDNKVREGLVDALRDKNPGVRLMVLDSLKGYVRDDVKVRDAVVEVLVSDNNAGVRQAALSLLDPVKADSSVRSVLMVLAQRDPNKFIRLESKRYLASTPHLD